MFKKLTPRQRVIALLILLPVLTAVIVIVSITACSQHDEGTLPPVASGTVVITPSVSIPTDSPSMRGFITRITNSAESTEILVEYFPPENETPEYPYDKVLIKLDANSTLAADNGADVTASSLTVGSTVEVWFSEPSVESTPVLAYGQALRVISPNDPFEGMRGLPRLTVTGTSKSLSGVLKVEWAARDYKYSVGMTGMLDRMRGAHITSAAGSKLHLGFSAEPDEFTVTWSQSPYGNIGTNEMEISEEGEITVPADQTGELYIRVAATWSDKDIEFGFSVTIVEQN